MRVVFLEIGCGRRGEKGEKREEMRDKEVSGKRKDLILWTTWP